MIKYCIMGHIVTFLTKLERGIFMNSVDKVINIALAEEGYLEKSTSAYKKNPAVLDSKKDGAGKDNYTKYGRDMHNIYPAVMDFPAAWCDAFVDWCFYKAYGIATAKSLLCGNFDDYTVASAQMYNNKGALGTTPKKGAQVFFTKNGKVSGCYHTGLVYKVDGTYFYTSEGNTSNSSEVVPNGGCVALKKYNIAAYKGKVIFGYPKYDDVEYASPSTDPAKDITTVAKEVLAGKWGNGDVRKNKLTAAGYNYNEVQKAVNALSSGKTVPSKSIKQIAKEVIQGKWGNGNVRKTRLAAAGYDPNVVQAEVNKML